MRRIRIAGLCLVAAFAMSVMASSTASAVAPEIGQCLKGAEHSLSNYSSAKCITLASEAAGTEAEKLKKGVWKWTPGFVKGKTAFTSSGGVATLSTKGGKTVTCTSETSTGNYLEDGTNKKEETVVNFAGCKSNGLPCTTEGKASGELTTNPLIGEVGFEVAAKKKTALKLFPKPPSLKFIEFKCVGLEIKVRGKGEGSGEGILVNIKNNAMKNTEILKYKQTGGVQKPVKWEGPNPNTYLESNFENLGYEQSGQEIESTVKNQELQKYELNTVL
jgi:hypothetical protein